ncbi:class I SAM-dependent methyltransferase [Sinorhizobium chiapasense]|uniref:Class I SAM-dependent methyltransferase n=1 Tax=Sinorhizobium chiapasense TaxID=501572 RepID=A0ABZ2BHM5_9HYPH
MESSLVLKIAMRLANRILSLAGGAKLYAPPGHFGSPIVNSRDVDEFVINREKNKKSEFPDFNNSEMDIFFEEISTFFEKVAFLGSKCSNKRYTDSNELFNLGDAYTLASIMASVKPRKFVEIGSGYSSACALDTVETFKIDTEFTFIEPYPKRLYSLLTEQDTARCKIVEKPVQAVDPDVFESMKANDILFIDSSHIMKTGSDVSHEFFEILPALQPGVIVHFHDIFAGWEYPEVWIRENNRSWNEMYALRAFLMYNNRFKILFFNDYFWKSRTEKIKKTPLGSLNDPGSGIYLRKT